MEYSTKPLYEAKQEFPDMLSLISQYVENSRNLAVLKYCSMNGGRVVLAHDKSKLVGFYIYIPGDQFFKSPLYMKYKFFVLDFRGIQPKECTVGMLSVIDQDYPQDVYYEMNKLRIQDARDQGFLCGLINMNADYSNSGLCKMDEWSKIPEFFMGLTETTIVETGVKNDAGKPILIQYY